MCVSVSKECECCPFAAGAAFLASGRGLVSGSLRNHGRAKAKAVVGHESSGAGRRGCRAARRAYASGAGRQRGGGAQARWPLA